MTVMAHLASSLPITPAPNRLDAYLTDGTPLPDETVNYVASIAPLLGDGVAMTGPLAAYANAVVERDGAYAGRGMLGPSADVPVSARADEDDPSTRAFAGGGLVTTTAPTGILAVRPAAPVMAAADNPLRSPFREATGAFRSGPMRIPRNPVLPSIWHAHIQAACCSRHSR